MNFTKLSSSFVLAAAIAGASGSVAAADYRNNPFTLVYDGAIRKNEAGKVNIHPVSYTVNGIKIAANVYTPANFNPNKRYPAIVVALPNGGVKEQVAGLYAQKLAEQGYVTIAFDAAYQGASGGEPRYVDKPANRIEDIRGAADFISRFKGVDADRIGLLGICGGGGYSVKAAQGDHRFKAVATLSLFNSGDARRNGFMRSQKDTIQQRLVQAAKASRRVAELTHPPFCVGFAAESENVLEHARAKRLKKGIPMLVTNDVATAMGKAVNRITIITEDGETAFPETDKNQAAAEIVKKLAQCV